MSVQMGKQVSIDKSVCSNLLSERPLPEAMSSNPFTKNVRKCFCDAILI